MRGLFCWLLGHRWSWRNIEANGTFVVYDIYCGRCGHKHE